MNGQWTTYDDGRQPIAIGHLSDLGDLKTETSLLIFKQKLAELKYSKQTGIEIYTDGSNDRNDVAGAAVIDKEVFPLNPQMRQLSIFSAEVKEIELAFE